ncbi:MAG: N-acyl homoserine lactonase family protein [Phenylobacterium sp.]|uniref:N-acyl homoserine lactonase family protein n=1 Tax=Phenylobacterium sp. TaxID=1871053 RepID=UPI002A35987F|nr:N-acyl homoserine lactonase family protein [Phenylobacterium sp.]MDX9997485.1 N-acyl homoserine lactonase family protein [Phenylobacterium sp.]
MQLSPTAASEASPMTFCAVFVAFSLSIAALAAARAAAAAEPDIALYAMDCGRMELADADAFADDGAYKGVAKKLVVPCYLIRHPKGDLIWDTGLTEAMADAAAKPPGMSMDRKLSDQLKELGLSPADIEYLAVSHSHFDHIGNGGLFAASTWIVDADERAYAFRPQARADKIEFGAYAALENAKTVEIKEDAPYDVFGDGSVQIVPAPGHTPGHSVLLVKLAQAGPVLLTGDLWHIAESREAKRVPRFNVDRAKTIASYEAVEKLAAEIGARVVRQHVPEDFDAFPKFPQPLR